jgi:nucleotide-binding universal stress UspA family protein
MSHQTWHRVSNVLLHYIADIEVNNNCRTGVVCFRSSIMNGLHMDSLNLLVSIKNEDDIACLMRYVRNFIHANAKTNIILLHVMRSIYRKDDAHDPFQEANAREEFHATHIINKASQYLRTSGIPFDAYIRHGDVSAQILDAAEVFDCKAIILHRKKLRSWFRLFSQSVTHRVTNSSRHVPVVLVDTNGLGREWRGQHLQLTSLLTPGWLK